MHPLTQIAIASAVARWNALIPKRACRVDLGPEGVRYLHPTKGWRLVSNKRLGLA